MIGEVTKLRKTELPMNADERRFRKRPRTHEKKKGHEEKENGQDWCAGHTGGGLWMRVPYDEGLASHIGPESCVDVREDVGEALTGEVRASH